MHNRNTIEFLGIWESLDNPDFKPLEFEGFRKQAGFNAFILSPQKWITIAKQLNVVPVWISDFRRNDNGLGTVIACLTRNPCCRFAICRNRRMKIIGHI
jgi:hypothetical protein